MNYKDRLSEEERVLGFGRVCLDEYLVLQTEVDRLGSTKAGARVDGHWLGGTVPRILACLSAVGFETAIIAGVGDDKAGVAIRRYLKMHGIDARLHSFDQTCRSIVLFDKNEMLRSIISIEETVHQKLNVQSLDLQYLDALSPSCVVTDARNGSTLQRLSKWAQSHHIPIYLDLGSTRLVTGDEMAQVASCATIVFASEFIYRQITSCTSLRDSLRRVQEWGASTVICSLPNGDISCLSKEIMVTVRRKFRPEVKGTLGAGDLFGGWFLAEFLRPPLKKTIVPDKLEASIRSGMTAVAWRLEQPGIEVPIPNSGTILRFQRSRCFESSYEDI